MSTKYEIQKVLTVSTAHISKQDDYLLNYDAQNKKGTPLLIVDKFAYGYYVYISESIDGIDVYSKAMRKLIQIAKEQGCQYLKLDRDGLTYDDLETFDW